MNPKTTAALMLVLLAALALPAPAASQRQRQRQTPGRAARDQGGVTGLARSFEAVAPAIGEPMPDVLVYDDAGAPHRLPELLREHYTVLILGCLT